MKAFTISFKNDKGISILAITKPFKSPYDALIYARVQLNKSFGKYEDFEITW